MKNSSKVVRNKAIALACGVAASLAAVPQVATAHGTVTSPLSRIAQCESEGVENMTSTACRAAVALSGTSGFYDINGVNQGDAADDHLRVVPDGTLCSGGQEGKYAGLDLARTDWVAAGVNPGDTDFTWTNTAPHVTQYYRYYITRDGHDFTQPLNWLDLDFIHDSGESLREATATHTVSLPERTGKRMG